MRPGECKGGDTDDKDIIICGVKWHVLPQGGGVSLILLVFLDRILVALSVFFMFNYLVQVLYSRKIKLQDFTKYLKLW